MDRKRPLTAHSRPCITPLYEGRAQFRNPWSRHAGKGDFMTSSKSADRTLDITSELCPMTFVRTRLALDRMEPGQTLLVMLKGEEPLRNVPRTAVEQGHAVLDQETGPDGITRLLLRRGGQQG